MGILLAIANSSIFIASFNNNVKIKNKQALIFVGFVVFCGHRDIL